MHHCKTIKAPGARSACSGGLLISPQSACAAFSGADTAASQRSQPPGLRPRRWRFFPPPRRSSRKRSRPIPPPEIEDRRRSRNTPYPATHRPPAHGRRSPARRDAADSARYVLPRHPPGWSAPRSHRHPPRSRLRTAERTSSPVKLPSTRNTLPPDSRCRPPARAVTHGV